MGVGCSGGCDSWVFDCKPGITRHNRRVETRNIIAESYELKNLKELRLVYPCAEAVGIQLARTIGHPRKWKADLHGFSLSLLLAALAFHAGLAASGIKDAGLTFSTCLYLGAVIIVAFIKGLSKEVVVGEEKPIKFKAGPIKLEVRPIVLKFGFSLIILVPFAFLPAFVSLCSDDPAAEVWAGFIGAVIIAFVSYKTLALSPEYLLDAKNSPPLLCDRVKAVWTIAAVVYGAVVVASLPRLLSDNAKDLVMTLLTCW